MNMLLTEENCWEQIGANIAKLLLHQRGANLPHSQEGAVMPHPQCAAMSQVADKSDLHLQRDYATNIASCIDEIFAIRKRIKREREFCKESAMAYMQRLNVAQVSDLQKLQQDIRIYQ